MKTFERYVLLDRDGVINRYRHNIYVSTWDDFEFGAGVLDALRRLNEDGYGLVVVSNQGGVGKGSVSFDEIQSIMDRMNHAVESHGVTLCGILWCPHAPGGGCDCRKPRPGMLLEASRRFGFDLGRTWFVGDAKSDMLAARAAGALSALVTTGKTSPYEVMEWSDEPDRVDPDLPAFVDWLLAPVAGPDAAKKGIRSGKKHHRARR